MDSNFQDFIEAEAKEILSAIDEQTQRDPELFRREAIAWIEKNAEAFRRRWDMQTAQTERSGTVC
jgi:hypothetical protein